MPLISGEGGGGLPVANPSATGTFFLDETGVGLVLFDGASTSQIQLNAGREFQIQNHNGEPGVRYHEATQALFLENMVAAAADGLFNTQSFQLWLDPTPAATKLMIKATDSVGTVRTAAIALA